MSVNALSAAKFACQFSNWSMPHLDLQKLLYIANMCHLGQTEKKPLVDGHFEAWDYGPVHPVVYHKVKIFGAGPVGNIFRLFAEIKDGTEKEVLEAVLQALEGASSAKLIAMTHREGGAWAKNYRPGARGIVIPDKDIAEEYHQFIVPEVAAA